MRGGNGCPSPFRLLEQSTTRWAAWKQQNVFLTVPESHWSLNRRASVLGVGCLLGHRLHSEPSRGGWDEGAPWGLPGQGTNPIHEGSTLTT